MTNPSIERDPDTPIGAPVHNYWPYLGRPRIPTEEETKLLDELFKFNRVSPDLIVKATELSPKEVLPLAVLSRLVEDE